MGADCLIGHPSADVDRVAGDLGAVGEHRAPVQAGPHEQLVLVGEDQVAAGDFLLQVDERVGRVAGVGEDGERPVSCGVDDAAAEGVGHLGGRVAVALEQAAPGLVAVLLEVGGGADHVGEHERPRRAEAGVQIAGDLVLELDDLGETQLRDQVEHSLDGWIDAHRADRSTRNRPHA